jgi:hypothetical protein
VPPQSYCIEARESTSPVLFISVVRHLEAAMGCPKYDCTQCCGRCSAGCKRLQECCSCGFDLLGSFYSDCWLCWQKDGAHMVGRCRSPIALVDDDSAPPWPTSPSGGLVWRAIRETTFSMWIYTCSPPPLSPRPLCVRFGSR